MRGSLQTVTDPYIVKQLIMNVNERSRQEVSKKSHGEISLTFSKHTGK